MYSLSMQAQEDEYASLDPWDIFTIVLYFVVVIAVGIIVTVRSNRGSSQGFFLAGKSMTFLPIAGSIFATNMGAPTFVGLAGSAAATGYAPVLFEWHATYMLIILGWIFMPIYTASATFTMPEYLRKRFGGRRLRIYYAVTQLVLIILTGISAEMYAGTLFIQQMLGWDIYLSTVVILIIAAIYTIGGGLAAVIWTDALQTIILVIGAVVLTALGMQKIGGYNTMIEQFRAAASEDSYIDQAMYGNRSCGFTPHNFDSLFRETGTAYPWHGLVFGLTLLATYFFCTNQVIVQRNLAAKNVSHSKAACVVASYLKLLPFFLFVWPGMISRILYPDEVACSDPDTCTTVCDNPAGCTNVAYPLLVLRVLPTGVRGLMLAALLAALMSSLTSMFNSASSIFTLDLWKECRTRAGEREMVLVGRIFGIIMIGISIAWLPVMKAMQGGRLWDYLQAISSYITPAWVVIFILGMFWKRCTETAAFWGLMAGLVTGVTRMGMHFSWPAPNCGSGEEDTRPSFYTRVHYLDFALILGGVTFVVTFLLTYTTQPRSTKQLRRVTWWTRHDVGQPELTDDESEDEDDETILKKREELQEKKKTHNQKAYEWFCGSQSEYKLTTSEKAEQLRILTDISEDPFWSRVCNINGVVVVAVTCFIIGFYA